MGIHSSPGPWRRGAGYRTDDPRVKGGTRPFAVTIMSKDDEIVANAYGWSEREAEANAEIIIKAMP